jgi:hypothetical protein
MLSSVADVCGNNHPISWYRIVDLGTSGLDLLVLFVRPIVDISGDSCNIGRTFRESRMEAAARTLARWAQPGSRLT